MIVGGVLFAAGSVIGAAGVAVSGMALIAGIRCYLREMEEPPSDLARRKWAQAKARPRLALPPGRTAMPVGVSGHADSGTAGHVARVRG
ncbi:MAG: hypothetical protein J2P32_16935 [Actinobacteria bacterium]|nr:hypothetical protein [Actinomycetota bacterium]